MFTAVIEIFGVLASLVSIFVAAYIGSGEVKTLRQKTGDRSILTSVLSGEIFARDHVTKVR